MIREEKIINWIIITCTILGAFIIISELFSKPGSTKNVDIHISAIQNAAEENYNVKDTKVDNNILIFILEANEDKKEFENDIYKLLEKKGLEHLFYLDVTYVDDTDNEETPSYGK